jgi:hypothetical protein
MILRRRKDVQANVGCCRCIIDFRGALIVPVSAQAADARLNRMIELWEQGKPAIGAFARFRDGDAAIYPAEDMVAYPVSTRVNTPKNDDSALIEPLPQKN